MRCPIVSCMKNVKSRGFPTEIKELLAIRVHLARDHGLHHHIIDEIGLRVDQESADLPERETLVIDVDQNEKWLEPP